MFSNRKKQKAGSTLPTVMAILSFAALTVFCKLMNYPLVIPLIILVSGAHIYFSYRADSKRLLHLAFLLTFIVFIAHAVKTYTTLSLFYTPVACVAMLTMLLFNDLELSFIMAFVSSLLVTIVNGGDFGMMMIFFLGSVTGSYAVDGARTRGHLIAAGLFTSVMQVMGVFTYYLGHEQVWGHAFSVDKVYPLAVNGFICAFVVAASLKVFEFLFGVMTNFSLLELSDFNQPLMKRMIIEAPGTYHHCLLVSNLAEAAANEVNANALLTRVGAYYHDVGKLAKPEYYVENQLTGKNYHDEMEPSMSLLVILNHVKEGMEIARKYKLNPMIIDFIPQHHGTSIVHYFYQRALQSAAAGTTVNESNFRYPGPKPKTKETAIVLLADSVEAAVRSIEEPTIGKIEEMVRKIVNNKFIDGQLDDCNLTLKEINKICDTFIRILGAMYHVRVKYPDAKNDNTPRKQPGKDAAQSATDKDVDRGGLEA